ncbi:UNVERIFIED_CONTAM: hypothetical protein GTU68_053985 [Idotea baltica]|nr:hypothetical protein [Idotea baltica]
MLDLEGTELSADEKELLQHPYCGGLIFFSRNFESVEQLQQLINDVRDVTPDDFLISVDHEGGRVQRFREGFTKLPPLATLYEQSDDEPSALRAAHHHAWLMASELRAMGIDFSFAPVLDLNYGVSEVIGDRAFHSEADIVSKMAAAYVEGMHEAGMAATGKHFPGHGAVVADSHLEIPVDERGIDALKQADMIPFQYLINHGMDAIMPAHVIYPDIDTQPAGFSSIWLQQILREKLGFDGVIFSDDLNMEGRFLCRGTMLTVQKRRWGVAAIVLVCNNEKVYQVWMNASIDLTSESAQAHNATVMTLKVVILLNRRQLLASRWTRDRSLKRANA